MAGNIGIPGIGVAQCQERQRALYHKCHRCVYRGKAADFVFGPVLSPNGERANGTANGTAFVDERANGVSHEVDARSNGATSSGA